MKLTLSIPEAKTGNNTRHSAYHSVDDPTPQWRSQRVESRRS